MRLIIVKRLIAVILVNSMFTIVNCAILTTSTTTPTTTSVPPQIGSEFTQILLDDSAFDGVVTQTIPYILGLDINQMTTAELNYSRTNALNLHNYYRNLHANTANLTLDKTVNAVAQTYSQYLAKQAGYSLVHSANPKFGENLFLYCQYGVIPNQTSKFK
jgi:uncharacterized protein YkwD